MRQTTIPPKAQKISPLYLPRNRLVSLASAIHRYSLLYWSYVLLASVLDASYPTPPCLENRRYYRGLPKTEAPTPDVPLPAEIVEPAPVQEKDKSVKFQEDVDKENEPPVDAEPTPQDEPIAAEEDPLKPKKRAHRGKRGGKKEAQKRALKESMQQDEIDGIVEGVKQMNQQVSVTPDVIYQTNSEDKDAPAGLLNLEIQTDQVLGHGSGGTLVFEGKFEGRDVAVKRMLGQYSELASQEVSLLEQSEDHPNVIRYFCRRQDEHFLYIALELCQASFVGFISRWPEGRGRRQIHLHTRGNQYPTE